MCLNCGCRMWSDKMGDERNITLNKLAQAAVASDMNGKDTLNSMKDAVESIKPEELDAEIAKVKATEKDHTHQEGEDHTHE